MPVDVPTAAATPETQTAHADRPPTLWEECLAPLLRKYFWALILGLVAIASARIMLTYNALSLTTDEPTHLAAGLELLGRHTYRLDPEDPPLPRVAVGLGPYLMGARVSNLPASWAGLKAIGDSGHPGRTIFLMRLGNLPFFLLACGVVCAWACWAFGRATAVLATGLFTCLPAVLADAGLATTDTAAAATIGAAFVALLYWAKRPTWRRAALLGLFTGVACLAKFSTLAYLPAAACVALVLYVGVERPGWSRITALVRERAAGALLAAAVAAVTLWGGYGFSVGTFAGRTHSFRTPLPEFFVGIRALLQHNHAGHGAFLLGHFSYTGWWYYFPVALAVKTPIGFLMLAAVGLFVACRSWRRIEFLMPLALVAGVLAVAMHGRIDIGIRHIEPVWIGLSLMGALGLRETMKLRPLPAAGAVAGGALALWAVASAGVRHPDYLDYFNEFAGKRPERILVDSNYGWGQDLPLLAARLRAHGAGQVSLADVDGVVESYPGRYEALRTWYGMPEVSRADPCAPAPGWNAIDTTVEQAVSRWPSSPYYRGASTPWYEQMAPTERVGSFLLFDVTPERKLALEMKPISGDCGRP